MSTVDPLKYKEAADEVDADLASIVDEFTTALLALNEVQEGEDKKVTRIRILLAFSLLEVIVNAYNCYFGFNLKPRDAMEKWLADYCFTNRNKTFVEHPYLSDATPKYMYELRSSMMHAFVLPESQNNMTFSIVNGDENLSEELPMLRKGLESKRNCKIIFISPTSLLKLFLEGYALMHPQVFKKPEEATPSDFTSMRKLKNEFHRRGAKYISLGAF